MSMAYLRCVGIAGCLVVVAAVASAAQLLDGDEDFKLMASEGFTKAIDGPHPEGGTQNDYAWSMAWFKGKLYVGTGRFQANGASRVPTAAQIWAYTPGGADGASGTWALAFTAPQVVGVPREVGYRWMTQCSLHGRDYLFVSTIGPV
ncbi:MAG TPA: hypothetical protein VMN56_12290 [Casimicrobiaceae bacterium]|nr:hypothetical protein [Casimicrobiaceae bacterium]